MSALESLIATSGEAPMLDSLDFTLPPASTAVVDRRQHMRAYPTSASTLFPSGRVRLRLGVATSAAASSFSGHHESSTAAGLPSTPFHSIASFPNRGSSETIAAATSP
jgi:hypothetical protein